MSRVRQVLRPRRRSHCDRTAAALLARFLADRLQAQVRSGSRMSVRQKSNIISVRPPGGVLADCAPPRAATCRLPPRWLAATYAAPSALHTVSFPLNPLRPSDPISFGHTSDASNHRSLWNSWYTCPAGVHVSWLRHDARRWHACPRRLPCAAYHQPTGDTQRAVRPGRPSCRLRQQQRRRQQ